MISLFLDTSSSYLSCAVIKDGIVLKSLYLNLERDMSKYALYKIKSMLDELNLLPKDVSNIVCVNGPGSFTGLRVGVTIAKTFAWALNIKLIGISSLFAMATSIENKDYIIPVIDARRNYFFAGIYDKNYNVVLKDCYISRNELLEITNKLSGSYVFVSTTDITDMKTEKYVPNIKNLFNHLDLNVKGTNPHDFVPEYLKKTEAEEHLND